MEEKCLLVVYDIGLNKAKVHTFRNKEDANIWIDLQSDFYTVVRAGTVFGDLSYVVFKEKKDE